MKKLVLCGLLLVANAANAGFFNELNKALEVTNGILGAATGTTKSNSAATSTYSTGYLNPTDAQLAQIENALKNATASASGNSAKALAAASPMLKGFLATVACSDEYGMRNIGRYTSLSGASKDRHYHFSGAMSGLKYHPKNTQCLSVTQIGNTSMPALNALKLKAKFVSDTSGETATKTYLLMKQEDGSWLIDDGLLQQ